MGDPPWRQTGYKAGARPKKIAEPTIADAFLAMS